MSNAKEIWAIVPARSGSKGFPGKNVAKLNGVPLLAHSILFAKSLPFVKKVVLSTDSYEYAEIGEKFGAYIPFLRSESASADLSMEEDILLDFSNQAESQGVELPDGLLWLRPTHPLREKEAFIEAYDKYVSGCYSSVCVVTPEDPRIFNVRGDNLHPLTTDFQDRSMVRRQDCAPAYRIFSGEFFDMPRGFEPCFLGQNIGYAVQSRKCRFDIDYQEDLDYMNYLLSTNEGRERYRGLLQERVR